MTNVSCPLISKSWAAPILSEWPEYWEVIGQDLPDCLTANFTISDALLSQRWRSSHFPWLIGQNNQWIDLGFFLSHIFNCPALRRDPKVSRPYLNWSALLFGIIPHSVPSCKNSKYSNFNTANSGRLAKKSYLSDSRARFLCPISDLVWASIISSTNLWFTPFCLVWPVGLCTLQSVECQVKIFRPRGVTKPHQHVNFTDGVEAPLDCCECVLC